MEETKKTNPEQNNSEVKNDTWGGGCPIWIFGNEESADNDLAQKFEITDE